MKTLIAAALLAAGLAACPPAAFAQEHGGHVAAGKGAAAPSSAAFAAAAQKMHRDMDFPLTGDADVDFVRGMIAHHQGAIDMARVVLAHGKDAEVRRLAEEVIRAQEGEITWMKDWLAKRGK